jgi:hypothetical protein
MSDATSKPGEMAGGSSRRWWWSGWWSRRRCDDGGGGGGGGDDDDLAPLPRDEEAMAGGVRSRVKRVSPSFFRFFKRILIISRGFRVEFGRRKMSAPQVRKKVKEEWSSGGCGTRTRERRRPVPRGVSASPATGTMPPTADDAGTWARRRQFAVEVEPWTFHSGP